MDVMNRKIANDFIAQMGCVADAPGSFLSFAYSRLGGPSYPDLRSIFMLEARERESFTHALLWLLSLIDDSGVAFLLAFLTASQVSRLDALLVVESASGDLFPDGTSLAAGLAFVFLPALILGSIFILSEKKGVRRAK